MFHAYDTTNWLVYSDSKKDERKELMAWYREASVNLWDIDYSKTESSATDRTDWDLFMEYQFHFSSLVNLYQVFEQHMRTLFYPEINHRTSLVNAKEEANKFAIELDEIRKILRTSGYQHIAEGYWWPIIDELNKVANVYKHGDENSIVSLYKQDEDIFIDQATLHFHWGVPQTKEAERKYINSLDEERLESYLNSKNILILKEKFMTNGTIFLKKDKTPFEKYVNAIIGLWNYFPQWIETEIEK